MSDQDKKVNLLKALIKREEWQKALSFAAKFPRLGEHRDDIIRGHECYVNPNFYRQLGFDIEQVKQKGVSALKIKYGS